MYGFISSFFSEGNMGISHNVSIDEYNETKKTPEKTDDNNPPIQSENNSQRGVYGSVPTTRVVYAIELQPR